MPTTHPLPDAGLLRAAANEVERRDNSRYCQVLAEQLRDAASALGLSVAGETVAS